MSTRSPAPALARIPGWQDASWQLLPGGTGGGSWLVQAGGRRAVLKVDPRPRRAPLVSRLDEQRLEARAAEAGIAGRVLFADETVLLTEYLDGRAWSRSDLDDASNLSRLAALLKRLHALPPAGRAFDPAAAATSYARRIPAAFARTVEHCLCIVQAPRPAGALTLCHGDLVAQNVIDGDGLRLIDWEYASDNDPLFDLAMLAAHHELSPGKVQRLLQDYCGRITPAIECGFVEQVRLYNALNWLWAAARPGTDAGELLALEARLA